jgi:hypothetical protein
MLRNQTLSPVLFLDFDGVLHRLNRGSLFERLPLLEQWLRRHQSVEVVLTTSWRLVPGLELEQLCRAFEADLLHRVIGVTPSRSGGHHHRGLEVLDWLDQNGGHGRSWRAIDDKAEWFAPELRDRLIVCDPATGLTEESIGQLDEWMLK